VSGVIQALGCDANTKVKAGQLCAKIDPRPYQITVDEDKSDLAQAEARFEKDKADLARSKTVFEHDEALARRRTISRKAIDKSRAAYEQAQARTGLDEATVVRLQAALHDAEANLDYTDIVAPVSGTVISRNVEIGQTAAVGSQAPPLFLFPSFRSTPKSARTA
jgi:RND family efflux transporter MFP subunit